ncbi:MAG: helix-turn-helix domain-containing protein [Patescibacteria group bacterium]
MNQSQALEILKTGANVFLTGEPGSGKTYTINQYVAYLRSHGIDPAITASTGIAATHIGGMTIHSWSGIGIKSHLNSADLRHIAANKYVSKRVAKAKVLIIDEISMLSPDTVQMVETICREVKKNDLPFGGIQIILVGDFFQLPPVIKNIVDEFAEAQLFDDVPARFAYDAPCWREAEFTVCYITEQHRQDDSDFVALLAKIRRNGFDDSSEAMIQSRKINVSNLSNMVPKLYSHNLDVDAMNDKMLATIEKPARLFQMVAIGHDALIAVMKKGCLSPEKLYLKVGASVMFTKNNAKEGYANGTLGVVESFDPETNLPIVQIRDGHRVKVDLADWAVEEDGKVKGQLTQIPLRLAWAITVHKSQGISLDEAVVDLSRVFEFGQGYVAISRVRRLSGLYIIGWNEMAFRVDPEVLEKDGEFRADSVSAEKLYSSLSNIELEKLEYEFIIQCDGELDICDVLPKKKTKVKISTFDETLRLWEEGKNPLEIAKIRGLSEKTIFNHIEALVKKGKITPASLKRIVKSEILSELTVIKTAFKKLKTDKLTPVFEHFQGKYSYDTLKLVRLIIK